MQSVPSEIIINDPSSIVRNRRGPYIAEVGEVKDDKEANSRVIGEVMTDSIKPGMSDLLDQLRTEILTELDDKLKICLDAAVDRVLERSESTDLMHSNNWLLNRMSDKKKSSNSEQWLPEKQFVHRNSILTDLFKISHIETVYHIFVAILIIFSMNTMLSDLIEKGGVVHTYHLELFVWAFRGLYDVFNCWAMMFVFTSLGVYVTFLVWSTRRRPEPKPYLFDWMFAVLYVIYQVLFGVLPVVFIYKHNLAPASTLIVTSEQVRMFMKSHAFIRANLDNAFLSAGHAKQSPAAVAIANAKRRASQAGDRFPAPTVGDGGMDVREEELVMSNGLALPPFSTYLYFLFAPTLVYQSSYPRTPYVRWRVVAVNFLQFGLCIIYNYYIFARFCFSYFADFGRSDQFQFSFRQLVISSFGCMLPGALVLLISFYAFLHCWMNAFAEMLRFGDRMFYKDWWNSFTFSAYYRGWNVVVHDWLFTYVYRDVYGICSRKKRRLAAQIAVFMLSAFVHEYILTVVFRFFYPVLFVIFGGAGFGIAHIKGRSRLWNIGIWTGLFIGMGILMCLYSMEWYARLNCPPTPGGPLVDLFLPRSWFC